MARLDIDELSKNIRPFLIATRFDPRKNYKLDKSRVETNDSHDTHGTAHSIASPNEHEVHEA